ncbi:MAG: endonuclease Q family protein [Patescibacteria group bacterium]
MRIISDFHFHSKYSRACSPELNLENIQAWGKRKGVSLLGTNDFTHPVWFKELQAKLEQAEPGLYKLKGSQEKIRFVFSAEISCIYKQGGRCRRVHVCLMVPSLETAEKIIENFNKRNFNLKADGRPIIGLSAKNLAEVVFEIDPESIVYPAHIWTPWFAVFGSKSGFDSLEECFEEITPYIFAAETGLSSDPPMNWRLSALDDIALLSNSDAHSPANIGREANVFETDGLSYSEIRDIIRKRDKRFLYTINFFPEEGRYYLDGHADCRYSCFPDESKRNKNICPVCKKELTLGVMHRVDDLADRKEGDPKGRIPCKNLVSLQKIVADALNQGKNTKKVVNEYFRMTDLYPEYEIILDLDEKELEKISSKEMSRAIINVRNKEVEKIGGYDGVYGKIIVSKKPKKNQENRLF